jgi:hypothetical protein
LRCAPRQLHELDGHQAVRDVDAPVGLGRVLDRPAALSAGGLLIVQDVADAEPQTLIDVINHANAAQARVILLDTAPAWPPKPSGRLLSLLHADIPWAAVLDAPALIQADIHPAQVDLAPVLAQAAHFPTLSNQQLGEVLAEREQARAATRDAYQRHIESSWLAAEDRARGRQRDYGLEL